MFLKLMMVFVCCMYQVVWAGVSLELETTNIEAEETVKIILTLDGAQASAIPDLSPLEQNFHIVGTQRSMNYTFMNGSTHTITQWIVSLSPKRAGKLSIPALQVGNDKTQPRQLIVSASKHPSDTVTSMHQGMMLIASTPDTNPYVNQQVIYTVKLYHSQRLLNINYQPPQIEDAVLIPLGTGRHHQEVRAGNVYAVEEQQYAIFPQKKGRITLVAPVLRVLVEDNNGLPKNVILRAKSTELLVKEQLNKVQTKDWLPAKQVSLKETYSPQILEVKEGEALTRTVILEAVGVPGQLLPKLAVPSTKKFSAYLEQEKETSYFKQGNIIGTSVIKITYLFKQAGTVELPALRVKWFNTETGQEASALLPATQAQVLGAPVQRGVAKVESSEPNALDSKQTKDGHQKSKSATAITVSNDRLSPILKGRIANWRDQKALWGFGVLSILLLGGLALLVRFFNKKPHKKAQDAHQDPGNRAQQPIKQKIVLAHLYEMCTLKNPEEVKTYLLAWAQMQWPGHVFLTLGDLSMHMVDPLFKQEISRLVEAVYSGEGLRDWSGEKLWELVSKFSKHNAKQTLPKNTRQKLPELNEL